MTENKHKFDILLLGATGFTGRLVAEYLARHAPPAARIGLVGRNQDKLTQVQNQLPERAHTWPVLLADSTNPTDMDRIAAQTRVVATTVGPYARYGKPLVAACAQYGTHYCDLTGESTFMRDCIDSYQTQARESGAKIVHTCGFDSIPSDLGVGLLAERLGPLKQATYVVEAMKGGFSGGTVASLMELMEEVAANPARRALLIDPYALSPERTREPDLGKERDITSFYYDEFVGQWVAPFIMASVNTRVVRRSNALSGYVYGRNLRYQEVSGARKGISGWAFAAGMTAGLGLFVGLASIKPTRGLLGKFLPRPGEGPDEQTRKQGKIRIRIYGASESGQRGSVLVQGAGDPGYQLTSGMMGESALCLAFDPLGPEGGVLTPQTAMGAKLRDRLHMGPLQFTFSDDDAS